ncbi:hypothetical protein [Nonomuraea salmonea]|uniref:hypothetical protein n=1 Tax=Nonomuraea salmonea TaxID=46181 RepID=UPI0031E8327C
MVEFRPRAGGFPRFLAPFIAPLILFFFVLLLLGAILTSSTPLGVLIGAIATGVLVGVLAVKHRRLTQGTVARFSPEGVELVDRMGFRVWLRWRDVTRIDVVDTQLANPRRMGRPGERGPGCRRCARSGSSAGASARCRRASPPGCGTAWRASRWTRRRAGRR